MNTAASVGYSYFAMEQEDNLERTGLIIIDDGLAADIQHIETRAKRAEEAVELVLTAINLLPNDRAWKEQLLFLIHQSRQTITQALKVANHMKNSGK